MLRRVLRAVQLPREGWWRKMLSTLRMRSHACEYQRLSDYTSDETLGNHLDLVFTVKHQQQRALNRIMRSRLREGQPMKVLGGRTPRPYREGLLVHWALRNNFVQQMPVKEPFGLDQSGMRLAVAAGDEVRVYDVQAEVIHVYRNPWFAQLHSVYFSADHSRLLVVSTGFDTVIEFDLASENLTWTWNAWDHGYDVSPAGMRVRRGTPDGGPRSPNLIVVDDPRDWNGFGLPTSLTAVHLNNACYQHHDSIFVTLFHHGRAVTVDRSSGSAREVMTGLLNPHGFEPGWNGEYTVTDTRRGQVIFFSPNFDVKYVLTFDACEPSASRADLGEWLQNVLHLDAGLYGAIDIHRSCIWLFEPTTRRYRRIAVDPDWAVQNVIAVDPLKVKMLQRRLDELPEVRHDVTDCSGLMSVSAQPPGRRRPWPRRV
ncbi:hypothetical protein [Tahibacter sp.]|uniref:hypothetical protein n=1 Tax=Tahibacter sp. TaxID=2056211 RepID=UPI0028C4C90A|nr:hypothetical protein [Tahibacter sp.]